MKRLLLPLLGVAACAPPDPLAGARTADEVVVVNFRGRELLRSRTALGTILACVESGTPVPPEKRPTSVMTLTVAFRKGGYDVAHFSCDAYGALLSDGTFLTCSGLEPMWRSLGVNPAPGE